MRPRHYRLPLKALLRRLLRRDHTSPKLLLLALLTGALTGGVAVLFEQLVEQLIALRESQIALSQGQWHWLLAFVCSALLGAIAFYLMHRFAPETAGSGIPEIEGALEELRPVRWRRVLPVKFFGGSCALSSGMILGREGPCVQLGGNIGKMVAERFGATQEGAHALLAAGAAGGLAAAFNAPLAGILFVLEELRPQFRYSFLSIKMVSTTVIAATVVRQLCMGTGPVFVVPTFATPSLPLLPLFLLFGALMGLFGYLFNRAVNRVQDGYLALHGNRRGRLVAIGALLAGCFGVLVLSEPAMGSGGLALIPHWIAERQPLEWLLALLIIRLLGTLLCFCSGIPGGIFAPSLALGTLSGACAGALLHQLMPDLALEVGVLPIVGMGALFAASVRAPVTGILLVTEMTNNYGLILPMMVTTLSATLVAQWLGGQPLYSQILARILRLAQKREHSETQSTSS